MAKEKRGSPTKGRKETSLCEETNQTQLAPAFSMLQTMVLRPGTATHEHREPKVREVLYMLVVLVVYLGVLIEVYKYMLV